jgi:hypothetical protein
MHSKLQTDDVRRLTALYNHAMTQGEQPRAKWEEGHFPDYSCEQFRTPVGSDPSRYQYSVSIWMHIQRQRHQDLIADLIRPSFGPSPRRTGMCARVARNDEV